MWKSLYGYVVATVLAGVLTLGLPTASSADTILFVTTGHTGAQVQVDMDHTQHWTYTPSHDVSNVGGGLFDLKRGRDTSANIIFNLFAGEFSDYASHNTEATSLLWVVLTPGVFTQQYEPVLFEDPSPVKLTAGTAYTAVLASPALTAGDVQYFIKGGSEKPLFLVDRNGNQMDEGGNPVPLPSALPAVAMLLAGFGLRRRSR